MVILKNEEIPEFLEMRVWEPPQLGISPLVAVGAFLVPRLIIGGVIIGGAFLLAKPLGLDLSRIPPAAILGAAGAGAFIISGVVPEGAKPFLTVAGVGLSLASLLVLFSGEAPAAEPIKPAAPFRAAPGEEVPDIPRGQLAESLNLIFPGAQSTAGGRIRSVFTDQKYEFSIFNDLDRAVGLFFGVRVFQVIPEFGGQPERQQLAFETPIEERLFVRVPSRSGKGETITVPNATSFFVQTDLPLIGPSQPKRADAVVELQMFRNLTDGVPLLFRTIGIKYAPSGFEF